MLAVDTAPSLGIMAFELGSMERMRLSWVSALARTDTYSSVYSMLPVSEVVYGLLQSLNPSNISRVVAGAHPSASLGTISVAPMLATRPRALGLSDAFSNTQDRPFARHRLQALLWPVGSPSHLFLPLRPVYQHHW
jgi:hypothetical protein